MNVQALAMAVAFGISLASNVVFSAGFVGDKQIGQISNENPTFVTPDGLTFSIWGVIYSLELIMVLIVNCKPSDHIQELFSATDRITGVSTSMKLIAAFALNAAWLPAYVYLENFYLSLVILVLYLIALLSAYASLNAFAALSIAEWLAFGSGVSCNISWAIVACSANLMNVLGKSGIIDENGVAGSILLALIVLYSVAILSSVMGFALLDAAWPAVGAWALGGIYRMQSNPNPKEFPVSSQSELLKSTAFWSSIALGIVSVLSFIRFATIKTNNRNSASNAPGSSSNHGIV